MSHSFICWFTDVEFSYCFLYSSVIYIKNISTILTIVSITTLHIEYYCSQQLLLNIVSFLSNLNSLSVLTFLSTELPDKLQTLYRSVLNSNKLNTIVLKKMKQFGQIHFLIDLCPRMVAKLQAIIERG
jgi:hypothetical protein